MADLVVTVPKRLWVGWLSEGDLAGDPASGQRYEFTVGRNRPPISPGERLYVVAHNVLRGFAPVADIIETNRGWAIVRRGDAVAVTIMAPIRSFQGWRERWWERADESPFPNWQTYGVEDWPA